MTREFDINRYHSDLDFHKKIDELWKKCSKGEIEHNSKNYSRNKSNTFIQSLCVSLKRDTNPTEKDLCEKEKCGKFEKIKKYDFMIDIEKYNILLKYLTKQKDDVGIVKIHMDTNIDIPILVKILKFMSKNGDLVNDDNFDKIKIKEQC